MSVVSFSFDVASKEGLKQLDAFLVSRSYVVGFTPTKADIALKNAIGKAPSKEEFPNVFRYFNHIASIHEARVKSLPQGVAIAVGAAGAAAAAAGGKAAADSDDEDDDDDDDMFGDDSDDDAVAAAAAAAAQKAADKKKKAKKIERSQVVYDLSPEEEDTKLEDIEAAVRAIDMDSLVWGEAFGKNHVVASIYALRIQAVMEDEKVGLYDLEDALEAIEGVQSVRQVAHNKL